MKKIMLLIAVICGTLSGSAQKGKSKRAKVNKEWKQVKQKDLSRQDTAFNSNGQQKKWDDKDKNGLPKHNDDKVKGEKHDNDDDSEKEQKHKGWKNNSDSVKIKGHKQDDDKDDMEDHNGKEKDKHQAAEKDKNKKGKEPEAVNVPDKVKDNFAKDFPGASNISWTKQQGDWKAVFTIAGMPQTAVYHANGSRQQP